MVEPNLMLKPVVRGRTRTRTAGPHFPSGGGPTWASPPQPNYGQGGSEGGKEGVNHCGSSPTRQPTGRAIPAKQTTKRINWCQRPRNGPTAPRRGGAGRGGASRQRGQRSSKEHFSNRFQFRFERAQKSRISLRPTEEGGTEGEASSQCEVLKPEILTSGMRRGKMCPALKGRSETQTPSLADEGGK